MRKDNGVTTAVRISSGIVRQFPIKDCQEKEISRVILGVVLGVVLSRGERLSRCREILIGQMPTTCRKKNQPPNGNWDCQEYFSLYATYPYLQWNNQPQPQNNFQAHLADPFSKRHRKTLKSPGSGPARDGSGLKQPRGCRDGTFSSCSTGIRK